MDLNILFAIIAGFCLISGLAGCVLPVLPGVPLAWAGLFAAYFCSFSPISRTVLVVTGIFAVLVTVLDSVLQPFLTKKFGGSKKAVWGATIGLVAAIFLGPLFILLAPFIGAFIGELLENPDDYGRAFKAAFGSFAGFLLGTGLKMICVIAFIWIFVLAILKGTA